MAEQPPSALTTPPKSPEPVGPVQFGHALHDSAIEVGEDTGDGFGSDTDSDPGYATDSSSTYSASICSTIRQHIYENGIRYHAFRDGKYAFPNDETEQNRDDMKHAMTLLLCDGRLHYAPIGNNPGDVLDLGTGSGIWAVEMADKYPSASILGVDLSPIQPTWVPPNLTFMVDDIEDVWLHPRDHFDYIHVRHTTHSIKNLPLLLSRAFKHLKPGGYIEFQEMHYYPHCDDDSMTSPYPFRDFMEGLRDGIAAFGSDLNGVTKLIPEINDAGFVGIEEIRLKAPLGIWPKDRTLKMAGLYWRTAIMDGLNGLANRSYGKGLGWSVEEIEVFKVSVRKSLMDTLKHTYFPLHIIYAQKPMP